MPLQIACSTTCLLAQAGVTWPTLIRTVVDNVVGPQVQAKQVAKAPKEAISPNQGLHQPLIRRRTGLCLATLALSLAGLVLIRGC